METFAKRRLTRTQRRQTRKQRTVVEYEIGPGTARLAHRGHGYHGTFLRAAIRHPRRRRGHKISAPRSGNCPAGIRLREKTFRENLDACRSADRPRKENVQKFAKLHHARKFSE